MSHATKETKGLILLPDREKGPFYIKREVEFGMKIVPTSKPGVGFVVEETE